MASDALDKAIEGAAQAAQQPPKAITFEIELGPERKAVVTLPVPVTDVELFRLNWHLSRWYAEQEAERIKQQRGIVLAPAGTPLPPPPGSTRN